MMYNQMTQEQIHQFVNTGCWKVRWYCLNPETSASLNGIGRASIQLDDRWFYCDAITHQIVGVDMERQHGDYQLMIRDDETNYQNVPICANAMLGNCFSGVVMPLPQPRLYRGNQSIVIEVLNTVDRTAEYLEGFYNLQIVLRGRERIDITGGQNPFGQ